MRSTASSVQGLPSRRSASSPSRRFFAAALHGPWLAGLGLVGSYATPFLVASTAPDPWALVVYLLVVTAAAFLLARLRLWRWLAVSASLAAIAWGGLIVALAISPDPQATASYILLLNALVLALLVVDAHRGEAAATGFDGLALGVLAGAGALALCFAVDAGISHLGLAVVLVVAAAFLAVALAFDAVAPAAGIAALMVLGLAIAWPIAADIAAEPILVVPSGLVLQAVTPAALTLYLSVLLAAGLALVVATTASLLRRGEAAMPPAAALALAGTFGPVALLACAYVRTAGLGQSIPFSGTALLVAAGLAVTADRLLGVETRTGSPGHGAAGSLHIAASAAGLALALTMLLEGPSLTLAFGLAALGCAFVSMRRPLLALRWSAAAFALLVLLRLGGPWTVLGQTMASYPGWLDILMTFAFPPSRCSSAAPCFAGPPSIRPPRSSTARPSSRNARGRPRHPPVGARPGRRRLPAIDLVEAGLYATLGFAMALGFARGALRTTSIVHRLAAPVVAVLASCVAAVGPVLTLNPIVTGDDRHRRGDRQITPARLCAAGALRRPRRTGLGAVGPRAARDPQAAGIGAARRPPARRRGIGPRLSLCNLRDACPRQRPGYELLRHPDGRILCLFGRLARLRHRLARLRPALPVQGRAARLGARHHARRRQGLPRRHERPRGRLARAAPSSGSELC